MNYKKIILFSFAVFIVAFVYRYTGITANTPFWVDEFSSANQARHILQHGLTVFTNPTILFEPQAITTHFIIAGAFNVLGQSEFAARVPSVFFGSLVPVAIFILARKLFDTPTAISSALFVVFSYFEIVWSRQARGYVLIQLITIASIYYYFALVNNTKKLLRRDIIIFITLLLLGVLTHAFFYILIFSMVGHFIYYHPDFLQKLLKKPISYVLVVAFLLLGYRVGLINALIYSIGNGMVGLNVNLKYYHSFLWREYGLITFLAITGFGITFATEKRRRTATLFALYVISHLFFVAFIFGHHISKYLLPIFPILLLFMAVSISELAKAIGSTITNKKIQFAIPILMTLFIIINGHKFVTKPKNYYSVNHDFREIANIDYHEVYNLIKSKSLTMNVAVIDTWKDRAYWYLGQNYANYYAFRWINGGELEKRTQFVVDQSGQKYLAGRERVKFIGELKDLKRAIKDHKNGFIFIDDVTLPKDVIEYTEKNLKKELYIDHYALDDNPYSIWPATLYSWGFEQ